MNPRCVWWPTCEASTDEPYSQVVPLPLGTANDMSRILKWGANFTGGDSDLEHFVADIMHGTPIQLDRWRVVCTPLTPTELEACKAQFEAAKSSANEKEDDEEEGEGEGEGEDDNEDAEYEKVNVDEMGISEDLDKEEPTEVKVRPMNSRY